MRPFVEESDSSQSIAKCPPCRFESSSLHTIAIELLVRRSNAYFSTTITPSCAPSKLVSWTFSHLARVNRLRVSIEGPERHSIIQMHSPARFHDGNVFGGWVVENIRSARSNAEAKVSEHAYDSKEHTQPQHGPNRETLKEGRVSDRFHRYTGEPIDGSLRKRLFSCSSQKARKKPFVFVRKKFWDL